MLIVLGAENKDVLKSAISLVHEVALKRNFSVNFEVIRSFGGFELVTSERINR